MRIETTETIIVKVGFLGTASEGIGAAPMTIHSLMTHDELVQTMLESFNEALMQAHSASVPIFSQVLKERFGLID